MPGFVCSVCGEHHEGFPLDIEYPHPAEYFTVAPEKREERVVMTPDYCIVTYKQFVIRGVLPVPIIGSDSDEEFRWGVWAIIQESDFNRYMELSDAPDAKTEEPPFLGRLSGGVSFYEESDMLPVAVQLRSGGVRPVFKVIDEEHPLGKDQRNGITMEQVHSFWLEIEQARREKEATGKPLRVKRRGRIKGRPVSNEGTEWRNG